MTTAHTPSGQHVSVSARNYVGAQTTAAVVLVSLALFGACILVLLEVADRNLGFALLALCLALLLLAPAIVAAFRRSFFPLEAIYLWLPMYAYVYLIKPIARLTLGDEFSYGGQDDLVWAMTVAIVGLLVFYAGYYSKLGDRAARHVPIMVDEVSSQRLRLLAWSFILIGGSALWVYMEHSGGWRIFWSVPHGLGGDADSVSAYVHQLPELMVVGFFLIVFDAMTKPRVDLASASRILVASIGGIGIYAILWSRRTFILWALLTIFVLYFLRKRKSPNIPVLVLFSFLAFVAVVLALAYRPYLHLDSSWDELIAVGPLERMSETLTQEGDEFDSFLAIVALYPEAIPYDYFDIYARIPLHPIPRFLWPEKPPLFVTSWDDFLFHSGITAGASESLLGDFYIQMGLVGVIVGMFASGILWRFFFAYLQRSPGSGFMQLVYAVALGNIPSFVAQSAISAIWKWFPLMIPSIVLTYLVVRRRS